METAFLRANGAGRFTGGLCRILLGAATVATGLMALPTVLDVAARALGLPALTGAMECVEALLLAAVWWAMPAVNQDGSHIRVELLRGRLSRPGRDILDAFIAWAGLAVFGLMAWNLARIALASFHNGDVTFMLGLPLGLVQGAGVLGLLALMLSLAGQCAATLRRESRLSGLAGLALAAALAGVLPLLAQLGFNPVALGGLGMAFLLLLLLLGLPIGTAMAGLAFTGMLAVYPSAAPAGVMLGMSAWTATANYNYAVVPMFILMGELALQAGISRELFRAAALWFGHLPGGLAVATISGCAGFAAVSGDSMATAVTMASVALPEMKRHGYEPGLACATLAAGGTLGILIPPSTGFIFYSLVTEESLGKLFVAGIVPGLLLALLFCLLTVLFALRHPELAPAGRRAPRAEKLRALTGVLPMLGLIVLVLGGILGGAFSPNEGGAVGAAGTLIYALARGRLTRRGLWQALGNTTLITARLLLILVGVALLGYFFAATALPLHLAEAVAAIQAPPHVVLALVIVFYMALGCVMNVIPMILLTLPAIFPAIMALGFDPLWFGVLVVLLMEMGQITPPVGLNVYAMATVAPGVGMGDIFRRITPFFLAMLVLALLLTLFPGLALWLPGLLF